MTTLTEAPVRCVGGPHDGRTFSAGAVPWTMWVPRDPTDHGPRRNLLPAQVLASPVGYYRYAGLIDGEAVHRFHPPEER